MDKNTIGKIFAKQITSIAIVFLSSYCPMKSQPIDPKVLIAGHSEGSVKKAELLTDIHITPSDKDIAIISFTMSYPKGDDDFEELSSKSDLLTDEMKEHIKKLKAGTKLTFENIKAKRGDKTLILESVDLVVEE
jgi:hypothetical protein